MKRSAKGREPAPFSSVRHPDRSEAPWRNLQFPMYKTTGRLIRRPKGGVMRSAYARTASPDQREESCEAYARTASPDQREESGEAIRPDGQSRPTGGVMRSEGPGQSPTNGRSHAKRYARTASPDQREERGEAVRPDGQSRPTGGVRRSGTPGRPVRPTGGARRSGTPGRPVPTNGRSQGEAVRLDGPSPTNRRSHAKRKARTASPDQTGGARRSGTPGRPVPTNGRSHAKRYARTASPRHLS